MTRSWSKTEITYLKRYAKRKSTEELAGKFSTDIPAVLAKLKELGIGETSSDLVSDPMLSTFEKALKAMQGGKWETAAKGFETVAQGSEQIDLAARARQFLNYCHRQMEAASSTVEDPYLMAVILRNKGELEKALELCTKGKGHEKDEGFAYLAASILALQGDLDASAGSLGRAIELNPKNRIQAGYDADFEELRAADAYSSIFASD